MAGTAAEGASEPREPQEPGEAGGGGERKEDEAGEAGEAEAVFSRCESGPLFWPLAAVLVVMVVVQGLLIGSRYVEWSGGNGGA
jgi:hypothetical protein